MRNNFSGMVWFFEKTYNTFLILGAVASGIVYLADKINGQEVEGSICANNLILSDSINTKPRYR